VGWARAWSNNSANLLVIAHELGHNFGLAHAASLDCGTNVIGGACSSSEYGDPFDVMGNNRAMHFNSSQKSELNWLPAGSVSTHASGTATYTLSPLEAAGGGIYAVKVPVSANRTYWIEYRQPIGFDAALSSFPNNGAQIRVATPFESLCSGCYDDTEFLDMTPATAAFTDGALVAGQSYTDTTYNFAFNVISATAGAGGQLTIQVSAGGGAATTTTTTLASNANPSNSGASVTFTATVTGTAPTGTVAFTDGATSLAGCSAIALTGSGNARTAACSTSALTAGTHSISAAYGGDAGNVASTSSALSQVVKSATSTTLSSSGSPSTVGASVTFTASVTGLAPTGSVNFKDGTTSLAGCSAAALTGSGNTRTAVCATSTLASSTHSISAAYAGDTGNVASTSATLSQVVSSGPVATSTTLASSINPSAFGSSVTFTATVSGSGPTGNVAFKDGVTPITGCSAVALAGSGNSRTALCSTAGLGVGNHSINAAYAGNGSNVASTSAILVQRVLNSPSAALPLYRFNTGSYHFYTDSETEKASVLATYPGWILEGISYYVFGTVATNTLPVYRLNNGTYHLYTISEAEKNSILAGSPQWMLEGVAFYAFPASSEGTLPVYRFNNGTYHFYTISETEKNFVLTNYPSWTLEGIAYYARTAP